MRRMIQFAKHIVTALAVEVMFSLPAAADSAALDDLFDRLAQPDLPSWEGIVNEIQSHWSRSGSAAMDLLLTRGRDAIQAEDYATAIAHLTALTDHAPDFAEGFNARATAYFLAGLYGPALADIRRTLALNPRHFGALTGLAVILDETGDAQTAFGAIARALALNPHDPDLENLHERLEKEVRGVEL